MCAEYDHILAACKEATAQIADASLDDMMQDVISSFNESTCVAIVDTNTAGSAVLKAASAYCGLDLPQGLLDDFRRGAICLTIENGSTESLLYVTEDGVKAVDAGNVFSDQKTNDVDELVYTNAIAALANDRFLICSSLSDMDVWKKMLNHIGAICIHVNATMAMTYQEKKLIELLSKRYKDRPVAIWLDMQEKLNNEEELECIFDSIRNVMHRAGVKYPIYSTSGEIVNWLETTRQLPDLKQKKEKCLLRNLLFDMTERIDALIEEANTSSRDYDSVAQQLNSQRVRLELAGRIAASATLDNTFEQMKYETHDGMRDYNEQMVVQICNKVASATTEELERMETLINTYQTRAWELYQKKLEDTLHTKYDQIFQDIMQRMEDDAGALFAQLDPSALSTLCKMMDIENSFKHSVRFVNDDLNSIEKLKRETRNRMLLSIPVLLVNIPLGLATLAGAKLFETFGKQKAQNEYRNALAAAVKIGAGSQLQQFFAHVDANFDAAKSASAENIQSAYGNLIDILIAEIKKMEDEHERLLLKVALYNSVKTKTIPELITQLTDEQT